MGDDGGGELAFAPEKGRLRLRAGVPVIAKYAGKKVDRREVFGTGGSDEMSPDKSSSGSGEDDGDDDAHNFEEGGKLAPGVGAGFNIAGSVEEEYEAMMQQSKNEIEVMRAPSAAEVDKRRKTAERLKKQMSAWSTLVELRIHLE